MADWPTHEKGHPQKGKYFNSLGGSELWWSSRESGVQAMLLICVSRLTLKQILVEGTKQLLLPSSVFSWFS